MIRCYLKRHGASWTWSMIFYNILCGDLDETRKQCVTAKQHANHFAALLNLAKQQDSDGCWISIKCFGAEQVDELIVDDVQDIL